MPTICRASDGHWFIRRGFLDISDDQIPCSTYQVGPKGDQVFDYLRVQDGDPVPMPLFYALLLDEAIFNPETPMNIAVYDLPERYWPRRGQEPSSLDTEFFRAIALWPRLSLWSVIEFLDRLSTTRPLPKEIVNCAVTLYIEAKRREETDRQSADE